MNSFYENISGKYTEYDSLSIHEHTNFSVPAHWHQELELIYVKKGSISAGVNQEVYQLQEGDIYLFQSGDIHYYDSRNAESDIIILLFRADLVRGFYDWLKKNEKVNCYLEKKELRTHHLEHIYSFINRICQERHEKKPCHQEMIKAYVTWLLIEIMRKWPVIDVKPSSNKSTMKQQLLRDILIYIELHIAEPLTLVGLAEEFHMDSFYLSKLFNQTTGMHFKNYLNQVRVALAKEKLQYTNDSMTDIAFACGFGSIRNFNRVFKIASGKTPGEYRSEE